MASQTPQVFFLRIAVLGIAVISASGCVRVPAGMVVQVADNGMPLSRSQSAMLDAETVRAQRELR